MPKQRMSVKKLTLLAVLLAVALILGLVERAIPMPVPGMRLGLPNVVVLAALYLFEWPSVLLLVIVKCVTISMLAGGGVSLLYSLSGSLLSFAAMTVLIKAAGDKVSPAGVSVVGAVLHNTGQLLAAALVMNTPAVFSYLPVLLFSGLAAGVLVGLTVRMLLRPLRKLVSLEQT